MDSGFSSVCEEHKHAVFLQSVQHPTLKKNVRAYNSFIHHHSAVAPPILGKPRHTPLLLCHVASCSWENFFGSTGKGKGKKTKQKTHASTQQNRGKVGRKANTVKRLYNKIPVRLRVPNDKAKLFHWYCEIVCRRQFKFTCTTKVSRRSLKLTDHITSNACLAFAREKQSFLSPAT